MLLIADDSRHNIERARVAEIIEMMQKLTSTVVDPVIVARRHVLLVEVILHIRHRERSSRNYAGTSQMTLRPLVDLQWSKKWCASSSTFHSL